MELSTAALRPADEGAEWYVLTSPEPDQTEEMLLRENRRRTYEQQQPIRFFIPYRYLYQRIYRYMPEGCETDSELYNQLNDSQLKKLNSFRALLRRYVFIQASLPQIQRLMTAGDRQQQYRTLWYYRDRQHRPVTVGNAEMNRFIQACQDQNCMFEVWPATTDLKKNQRVLLHATAFRDSYAYVVEVKPRGNDVDLTVALPSITDDAMIILRHLRLKDVSVAEQAEAVPQTKAMSYRFVENTQRQVLGLLARLTVNNSEEAPAGPCTDSQAPSDAAPDQHSSKEASPLSSSHSRSGGARSSLFTVGAQLSSRDADLLSQLSAHRHKLFASPFLQAKFTALMILLSLLDGNVAERDRLVGRAATAIADLQQRGQQPKLTSETVAYVQAALFLATGLQRHYDAAMTYYNAQPHHSAAQQQLIKLMRQHFRLVRT